MSIKTQWKRIKRKAAGTAKGIKHRIDTAIAMLVVSILAPTPALADINKLGTTIKTELNNSAAVVLDVMNTIVGTIGVVVVIFTAILYLFNPEAFKQNSKVLLGAIAGIGILYAITRMGLSAFN